MQNLKEYLNQKDYKKIGISRFYRNVIGDIEKTKNPGPLDIHYLHKFLIENGFEVSIIGQKEIAENDNFIGYKYTDIHFNDYDAIIFQPYTFLLFGGIWMQEELDFVEKYTTQFTGETMVIFNDPNIPWENPYALIINLKRNNLGLEKVPIIRDAKWIDDFKNKNTTALFVGENYEEYKKLSVTNKITIWPENHINIPLSTYIFKNEFAKLESIQNPSSSLFKLDNIEKKYDVCYFGSNRKGSRARYLKKVFNKDESLNKLWIGYEPEYPNTTFLKKVTREQLPSVLENCLTSIVVGDAAHNDNIITYRFFENSLFGVFSVIYDEYDTKRKLIQNEELQKITYFKDIDELNAIVSYLRDNMDKYDSLLKLQRSEIERIFATI